MQKRDPVIQICEGLSALLLIWVILGNTFMTSFFAYPANFNSRYDILHDYWFLTIFNNELAYDGLIFINAFVLAYTIQKRPSMNAKEAVTMCMHYLIKTLIPVAILTVWGMSAYLVMAQGPMWSTNGSRII